MAANHEKKDDSKETQPHIWTLADWKEGLEYYQYVRTPKTSDSHPIRVDIYKADYVWTPGFLGMTIAPGKKQIAGFTADHDRDLGKDLDRLRNEYGVDTIVTLVEEHELRALEIANLFDEAARQEMNAFWHPIPDMSAPREASEVFGLVQFILQEMKAGRNVIVHCKGGLGRTGAITACVLVALGWDPKGAVGVTRWTRPGTIQTDIQELLVYKFFAEYGVK